MSAQNTLGDDALAKLAYDTYSATVGGKAFNGDPLPDWETFKKDPNKAKQADAWRKAGRAVADRVIKSIPKVARQVVAEAVRAGATFTPGKQPPPLHRALVKRTTCCGSIRLSLKQNEYACPCGGTRQPINAQPT